MDDRAAAGEFCAEAPLGELDVCVLRCVRVIAYIHIAALPADFG